MTTSRNSHLSVAETSLRLDLRDDFQLTEVDLKPLVNVAGNLLLRTPRSAVALRTNSAQRIMHIAQLNVCIVEHVFSVQEE